MRQALSNEATAIALEDLIDDSEMSLPDGRRAAAPGPGARPSDAGALRLLAPEAPPGRAGPV